ncbi:MAG: DUF4162 domain-containing protein, partial [Armatimonadetes bacterium]|nr:DUF4162 domain-containing protein [Armatimonadota bacterium]
LDEAVDAMRLLDGGPGVTALSREDGAVVVEYDGPPEGQHVLLTALVQGGCRVLSFRERETNLEQVFLQVTQGAVA